MVVAWALTFPIAALAGALMWWVGHTLGGVPGALLVFVILCAASGWMYHRSRQQHVGAHNVNAEWDRPGDVVDHPAPAKTPTR